jgi:hypothetical protein
MRCKACKGTGIVAQIGYDGEWEPMPCDCTVDPEQLEDSKTTSSYKETRKI